MFWDRVAGVYDIFANFINTKTHRALCRQVAELIDPDFKRQFTFETKQVAVLLKDGEDVEMTQQMGAAISVK